MENVLTPSSTHPTPNSFPSLPSPSFLLLISSCCYFLAGNLWLTLDASWSSWPRSPPLLPHEQIPLFLPALSTRDPGVSLLGLPPSLSASGLAPSDLPFHASRTPLSTVLRLLQDKTLRGALLCFQQFHFTLILGLLPVSWYQGILYAFVFAGFTCLERPYPDSPLPVYLPNVQMSIKTMPLGTLPQI